MNAVSGKQRTIAQSDGDNAAAARSITLLDNCIQSGDLFAGRREITIAHGVDVYRLRLTSQNKLILTK